MSILSRYEPTLIQMYEEALKAMEDARINLKNEQEIRKKLEVQLNECELQARESHKGFLKTAKAIAIMAFKIPQNNGEILAAIQPVNDYIAYVQQICVIKKQLEATIRDEKVAEKEYKSAKKLFEKIASITSPKDSNTNG